VRAAEKEIMFWKIPEQGHFDNFALKSHQDYLQNEVGPTYQLSWKIELKILAPLTDNSC